MTGRAVCRAGRLVALLALSAIAACGTGGSGAGAPGARGGAPLPHVADQTVDGDPWLAEARRRLVAAGAEPLRAIGASMAAEGDRVGAFVETEPSLCLAAVARPSRGITDTDLYVFNDGGDLLASDESSAADAAVVVCPPHPRRLYVAARVMAGRGMVAVGVAQLPSGRAEAVSDAIVAADTDEGSDGRLAVWPGLETKIRRRRRSLGSQWQDVRRALLPAEPRATSVLSVPLEAGRCLDVLAVPDGRIHSFDLWVTDARGTVLARGQPPGQERAVLVCAAHPGALTIHVRPRLATGTIAVVVSRSAPGAAAELRPGAAIALAHPVGTLTEAKARHRGRTGSLRMAVPVEVGTVMARVGAAEPLAVRFERGCTRLDGIGGAPLGAPALALWSEAGQLLGRASGAASTTLFRCGEAGRGSLEVRAELAPGPVFVEARVDRSPPVALQQHPMAAGRLLGLLETVAGPVDPSAAAAAAAVPVAARHRRSLAVVVPAGGCAEAFVAVAHDVRGVALRYDDPATGDRAISRGAFAAFARICSPEATEVPVVLEVDGGDGAALVLTRSDPRDAGADSAAR